MITCYKAKTNGDMKFISSLFCPKNCKYMRMNKQTPAAVKKSISPLRIHYIIKTGSQNIGWFNLRKPFDSTIGMFGMIIDKPFQGQGFGQEAMKLIKQEAKKIGIKKLLLEVESKNFKAINLYVGFGFKATRRFIEMEKKI